MLVRGGDVELRRVEAPRWARLLIAVGVLLVALAGFTYVGFWSSGFTSEVWHQVWWLFDVGREFNIPAWYSSAMWVVLGFLGVLGAVLTRRRVSWTILAAVGFLAGLDEYAELHERLDVLGARVAESTDLDLWYVWVLVGIPIALGVVVVLLPLLFSLPRGQAILLATGGALFLLGAIVVETLSGMVLSHFDGNVTWHYVLVTLVEEACEIVGLGLAVAAVAGVYRWRVTGHGLRVEPRSDLVGRAVTEGALPAR